MPAPSLCGNFLQNKRALIAFTWTLTTVLTLVAFILTLVYVGHVHTRYLWLERYYEEQYTSAQQQRNQEYDDDQRQNNNNNNHYSSQDERDYKEKMQLAHVASKSITFVSLYTMSMSVALVMYGSTAIVGFTSLRGVYIAPCFSNPGYSSKLKVGIFGGAIILFANLLLVCAVIFGEVRVENWDGEGDGNKDNKNDREPYEVERIATILAVCCMFLSALYTIFAILLFLYYVSDDDVLEDEDDVVAKSLPALSSDPRRENFITIGERLQTS
ncbi:hypothetical protein MPSEU_000010200 [Mayamaea pseudoterrestris]|nr:hypothetical protein MPSEU_000010200 [Mayamaea pseudoterrestris]